MRRKPKLASALWFACLSACLTAPQSQVEYDATFVPPASRTVVSGAWTVTLTRAELAFGPAYFCAAASGSSTLCASAVAELRDVVRIDALSPAPVPLGRVHGVTGSIRSVSYDLGILWLDSQSQPTAHPHAPAAHSGILEGHADKEGDSLPFVIFLDAVPQYQGQHAVATARAEGDVASSDSLLEVHVDVARWVAQIDFDAAAQRPERPLVVVNGSADHGAVLVGLKNLAPPEFRWVEKRRDTP